MASRGDAVVSIGVDTAPLDAGLGRAVDGAGAKLRGLGPSARGATSEIARFKEGLSRSRESAMFFTASLGELGPAGRTAQYALSGIAGAVLGGGGVLLALEGMRVAVRLGVEAWTAHKEEAKKTREELTKVTAEAKAAILQLDILKAKRAGDTVGAARIEGTASVEQARKAYVDARKAVADYIKSEGLLVDSHGRVIQATEQQFAKVEALRQAVTKADAALRAAYLQSGMSVADAQGKTDKEAADAQVDAAREALERAHRRDTSGQASVADFFNLEAGGYSEADVAKAAEAIARFEREALARAHAKDTSGQASVADFASLEAGGYDPGAAARAAEGAQAAYNAELERSKALAVQWGSAIGETLGMFVAGQMSAREAVAKTLQMMIKEATSYAITAAIGGAKSQSAIPVVGPVLAISAAGSLLAMLTGMIGGMPSAAGGMKVPRDMLAMIHEDEHVIPKKIAQQYEAGLAGGGGGNLTVQITAMDTRDVLRSLRMNKGALVQTLREIARDGRR